MKKILVASLALFATASVASAETVRLGTEGAYMPWNGLDDNNEVIGFEREVGDAVCEIAGLTCEWVINDWDSIIPNLVAGNYDAIIAGMSITAERDEVIDFTAEYYPPSPSLYMALAGGSASGVIAAQTNTIQAGYVAEAGGDLIEFSTPDETIAAVKSGEADAVLADGDYLVPIVAESGGVWEIVGDSVYIGGGVGMGVRETDGDLKAAMDAAIEQMKSDGSLNALIIKWFDDVESDIY